MASFDQLPQAPRTNSKPPIRQKPKPLFEFKNREDKPKGVAYHKTADGFIASAPSGSWIMAILLGLGTSFLFYILWRGSERSGADASFFYFVGAAAVTLFLLCLHFSIGRVRVKVKSDKLYIGKTILGIGIPRRLPLLKIERLRMVKRGGIRFWGWAGPSALTTPRFQTRMEDQICEIETDERIYRFGSHLRGEHLHYLRFIILDRIKEVQPQRNEG
jgi:hypothetical protein